MDDQIQDLPADWWIEDEPQQPLTRTDRRRHEDAYSTRLAWLEGSEVAE